MSRLFCLVPLCLLFACVTPTHYACKQVADGVQVCSNQLVDGGVP